MLSKKWIATPAAALALCAVSGTADAQALNFGSGCPGFSGSTPTIGVAGIPPAIVAGSPFTIEVTGLPNAAGPTQFVIGGSSILWGGIPLPLDLASFPPTSGLFPPASGCSLLVARNSKSNFALDGNGDFSLSVTLNGVGLTGYIQAFVFDPDTLPTPTWAGGLSDGLSITTVAPSGNTGGELVITEYLSNPSAVLDSAGEWFEVYNPGVSAIDIEGWFLADDDIDLHRIDNGGSGVLVPGGGYVVLGRNADFATNGGVLVDYEYADYFLANSADEIVLYDQAGVLIDRIAYGSGWPAMAGASTTLDVACLDDTCNDDSGNWCSSTAPLGGGDAGTPGAANTDCVLSLVSYAGDVHPIWTAKNCVACHPNAGGMDLGGPPSSTYPEVIQRVDLLDPPNSRILLKPLSTAAGGINHGGGNLFPDTNDPDYQTILLWITQGALNN